MKYMFIAILLLFNGINALAVEQNGYETKGTDQTVLEKLAPSPSQDDVSKYTKIQILFNVPLDSGQIKKHDIKLTYLTSQTNDHIDGAIAYSDNLLTFSPDAPLEPGVYEVEIKSLKAVKDNKDTQIKEIKYRFTVVKEILQNIVIQPDELDLKESTSVSLKAIGQYDTGIQRELGDLVQWQVGDTSVATVDDTGNLTALREGDTTVSATHGAVSGVLPLSVRHQFELLSPAAGQSIPYSYATLEVNASRCDGSVALNERLVAEQNRTIALKGAMSDGLCYFYNVPLLAGENAVAIADGNGTVSKTFTLSSEGLGYPPIGMRAGTFSGVGTLQTTVEAGTSLDAATYLFDADGDGSIDAVSPDGIFSVDFSEEGRYRPRVTVRTTENLLFSSNDYALSLDVKATADQKDPAGAQPVDIAKVFVQAILKDDRQKVERLVGYNSRILKITN